MEVDETTPAAARRGGIVLAATPFSLLYLQTNVQNYIEVNTHIYDKQQHTHIIHYIIFNLFYLVVYEQYATK
jgi:hypothetical protein